MHYLIGLIILCFNLIILYRNFTNGIILYFVLSFIMPNIHFADYILTYELFAFIPVFVLFIITKKHIIFDNIYYLLYIYLVVMMFSSLIAINRYYSEFNWIGFLGYIRFALKVIIFSQIVPQSENGFERILLVVIITNALVSIIQILFPQTVTLFYMLYYRPSLTPLKEVLDAGRFYRSYGTFGTPVHLGGFSLVSFSFFCTKFINNEYGKNIMIGSICSLIAGFLSLTKSFILGLPIIIIMTIILAPCFVESKTKTVKDTITKQFKKISIVLLVILTVKVLINKMRDWGLPVNYYFNFLSTPLDAFSSRYDYSSGILSVTREVIRKNLLIGVGFTNIKGEFIGDSSYFVIMHDAGLMGVLIYVFMFALLLRNIIIKKDFDKMMILISIIMLGFSQPIFTSTLGSLILGFFINSESKYKCNLASQDKYILKDTIKYLDTTK